LGVRLPRIVVPGFDYQHHPPEQFEVPLAQRIAAIRARKAEERARAKAKAERKGARPEPAPRGPGPRGRGRR